MEGVHDDEPRDGPVRAHPLPTGRVFSAAAILILFGLLKLALVSENWSATRGTGEGLPGFFVVGGLTVSLLMIAAGIAAALRRAYFFALAVPAVLAVAHLLLGMTFPWLLSWPDLLCWTTVFLLLNSGRAAFEARAPAAEKSSPPDAPTT